MGGIYTLTKEKSPKYFIITIDTEGDNLWADRCTRNGWRTAGVANAADLERFQLLCEKYQFIPTWLVNYEMSQSEIFQDLGKCAVNNHKAEMGMHIHAWSSPPIEDLPYNREGHHPYIGEYGKKLQWEKMKYLTYTLEEIFQCPITGFRSGRWYLDEFTLKCLKKLGFVADCTVTPGVSWGGQIGNHLYGTDYSKDRFKGSYQLSGRNIHKRGKSGILEVPPTILPRFSIKPYPAGIKKQWLRPNGQNLDEMLWIVNRIYRDNHIDYLEFMIHSSELSPGMNPTFRSPQSIEMLYADMEILFKEIKALHYKGIGLSDYAKSEGQMDERGGK